MRVYACGCVREFVYVCCFMLSLSLSLSLSLFMVDPLSYFSFKPVLHDWYNKGLCAILSVVRCI